MSPIYVPGKVTLAQDYTEGDRYFSNVSLLLQGDADGSGNILDSSPSPKTVSKFGNAASATPPSYPNSNSAFGNAIAFDGNGDYLSTDNSSDFDFGSSDFTIEIWVNLADNVSGTNRTIICKRTAGGAANTNWLLVCNPTGGLDGFRFYASDGATYQVNSVGGGTVTPGTWQHVAVVRFSNTFTVYVGGLSVGNATWAGSIASVSRPQLVAYDNSGFSNYFNGYIDEFRITKGVARYTSNFTPPTAPFADAQY